MPLVFKKASKLLLAYMMKNSKKFNFFILHPEKEKQFEVIDPINNEKTLHDLEAACKICLTHEKEEKPTAAKEAEPLKTWWDRKWYVALDYYLCTPAPQNNPIKNTPQSTSTTKHTCTEDMRPLAKNKPPYYYTTMQAILQRQTYRHFETSPLSWLEFSALLRNLKKSYFPEIWQYYCVVLAVENLPMGVYRYFPQQEALQNLHIPVDREQISAALCGFFSLRTAAFTIVLAINVDQAQKCLPYDRALRHIYIDAGRLGQRLLLQGMRQKIGGVPIAIRDECMVELLQITTKDNILPIHTITMGKIPKEQCPPAPDNRRHKNI